MLSDIGRQIPDCPGERGSYMVEGTSRRSSTVNLPTAQGTFIYG